MDLTMIGNVIAGVVIIFLALGVYRMYKNIRKPKTPLGPMGGSGGSGGDTPTDNPKDVTKE